MEDNTRTTPEEHEELVKMFSKHATRPGADGQELTKQAEQALPNNILMWMSIHLPWMGLRQEKYMSELLRKAERMMGRSHMIRFTDWGFDPRKVTPEDLIACAQVINGWATALERRSELRCGLNNGEYFVLMLRQKSCVMCPELWTEAKNVLHSAIAHAQMEHTCPVCYDVGKILRLGTGCCGDPACTDLVNADPYTCACVGGKYEPISDSNTDSETN